MFAMEKTIVVDLYERYSTQEELTQAVIHDLEERGKQCKKVDHNIIQVNNKAYCISNRTYPINGFIVRQAVLHMVH